MLVYLAAGQPLVGRWSQRRFARALGRDRDARLRRYRRTAALEWLLLGTALVPRLGPVTAVAASAAAFGLAHLYQGPWGVFGTSVLGGCLAVLYLGSGSLLLPACYHALLDLRVLLLPVSGAGGRHAAGS